MDDMISFKKNIYKQPTKELPISMRFLRRKDVCELFDTMLIAVEHIIFFVWRTIEYSKTFTKGT